VLCCATPLPDEAAALREPARLKVAYPVRASLDYWPFGLDFSPFGG